MSGRERKPPSADTLLGDTLDAGSAPARGESEPGSADPGARRQRIESADADFTSLREVDPESYVAGYEVARGGMGRILAVRDRRLGRKVAIKELIDRSEDRDRRFEREALITARLQHPSIVGVYEAGRWPSGDPFYAMKLVSGRPLSEVLRDRPALDDRLALLPNLIAVVEALAYAHEQRVVHRDLKPANLLLGDYGETVVIDWGLAKLLGEAAEDAPGAAVPNGERAPDLTLEGSIVGTPAYMAPEQAAGEPVDERADVYSLGAILYHLLAGAPPYLGESADRILQDVLRGPPAPLPEAQPETPEDLATIVSKAMARDPAARYRTAKELAEDLVRFRRGKLVAAHSYSARELFARWVARHRAAIGVAGAALAVLVAVGVFSVRSIIRERDRAEQARSRAAARADELILSQARSRLERDPREALASLGKLSLSAGRERWRAARAIATEARARGIPRVLRGHEAPIFLESAPDGSAIATGGEDGRVNLWNPVTGERRELGRHEDNVITLAFSRDGARLASGSLDNDVRVWDLEAGTSQRLGGHRGAVVFAEFLPGGGLISCGLDGAVRAWGPSGGETRSLALEGSCVIASSPAEPLVALGREDAVRLWDPLSGESRDLPGAVPSTEELLFSEDGRHLAAFGAGEVVRVWEVAGGEPAELEGHEEPVRAAAFSPDGRRLASAGEDHTVRLWELGEGGAQGRVLRGHEAEVDAVAFSADGRLLATAARDGKVKLWRIGSAASPTLLRELAAAESGVGIAFAADDGVLATSDDEELQLWSVGGGSLTLLTSEGDGAVASHEIAVSPDGSRIAAATSEQVKLWDLDAGGEATVLSELPTAPVDLRFSPDGQRLAAVDAGGQLELWDLEGGPARAGGRPLEGRAVFEVDFSPGGRVLAAPGNPNLVALWDAASGEARVLRGHESWVATVAFSPDGRALASAGGDGELLIWDLRRSGARRRLGAHEGAVWHLAFDRRAEVLLSAGDDGVVRLWELSSESSRVIGEPGAWVRHATLSGDGERAAWVAGGSIYLWAAGELSELDGDASRLAFSPDGRTLAAAGGGRELLLWDTASRERLALEGHLGRITDVAFDPRGGMVATAATDGTVRIWPLDVPEDPAALRAWIEEIL